MGVIFLLGPYMLGTGLLCYLLSKEIYIINHETLSAASIGAVVIYAIKKFGPSVAAFADKLNEVGLFTISSLKWLKIYSFDILILGLRHKHFCIVH
jgi:F-type H+-transporting ATPase subunit b